MLENSLSFLYSLLFTSGYTSLLAFFAVALLANYISRSVFSFLIHIFAQRAHIESISLTSVPFASRLANLIPILVLTSGVPLIQHIPARLAEGVVNTGYAFIVFIFAALLANLLDYVNLLYLAKQHQGKPIKGYLQTLKLIIYLIATILVVSILLEKSPLILLSGLGAIAAVLMLIFQDTILSIVASIQISINGSVKVGDWIEVPQLNADGVVIDIALHTITIQNWDKTYTVFPTKRLVTDAVKNWRGIDDAGGRRIKRALHLDQNSVHFLTPDDIEQLQRFDLLHDYLQQKKQEIQRWNQQHQATDTLNQRQLTNLGAFRAYTIAYLQHHEQVHQGMSIVARHMSPSEHGIPLEIYCFSKATNMADYENLQADVFDHLLAILPQFGLRVFQHPSGSDLMRALPKI